MLSLYRLKQFSLAWRMVKSLAGESIRRKDYSFTANESLLLFCDAAFTTKTKNRSNVIYDLFLIMSNFESKVSHGFYCL